MKKFNFLILIIFILNLLNIPLQAAKYETQGVQQDVDTKESEVEEPTVQAFHSDLQLLPICHKNLRTLKLIGDWESDMRLTELGVFISGGSYPALTDLDLTCCKTFSWIGIGAVEAGFRLYKRTHSNAKLTVHVNTFSEIKNKNEVNTQGFSVVETRKKS